MKKKFVLMITALVLLFSFSLSGCSILGGGKKVSSDTLQIRYYSGGAGKVWMEDMAKAFTAESGIEVKLTADNKMTENSATLLESNRDLPDLMFILYTNWQAYVQKGWLEPLDSIYDGTFDYCGINSLYEGKTLKETMEPEFVDYGLMAKSVNAEKHYYAMPWTAPTTGLVYNVKMLKAVGYDAPPKTEVELKDLCTKLVAAGKTPFAWGGFGMEMGYWDFPVLGWWAQYSGKDVWKSFYEFESPEVFKDEGRVQALRLFSDLMVDSNGDWKNSIVNPTGRDHMDAQRAFVKGEAAMMPTGSWIENEVNDFILPDFEMKMMPLPAINGAKTDSDGNVIRVNNTEAGDFACIPANAKNKDSAKAFLAFMNRMDNVKKFTKTTGMARPFVYKPSEIAGITDFQKSCFELFENSQNMYRTSKSPIFTYVGIREWSPYGKQTVYGMLAGKNKMTPQKINSEMFGDAEANWDNWKSSVGM